MYLDAMVEDERRVAKWKEWERREAAHKALWTQFQLAAVALTQLYILEGGAGGGRETPQTIRREDLLVFLVREQEVEQRQVGE